MKSVNWMIALTCFLLLIGCTPLGIIPTGSEEHKATILYFKGGSGRININATAGLFYRWRPYFTSQGIIWTFLSFDFPKGSKGQIARTTESHFQIIQKKVNDLRKEGHERIWLMGQSNGGISVMHAGARQIKGVEGLIAINPASIILGIQRSSSGILNLNPRAMSLLIDLDEITLPIMLIVHEKDWNTWAYLTEGFFKQLFSSSKRAEIVMFSGGRTGTSPEATHLSPDYQHGLRGLEKEFVQTVINFIDSNSDITEAGK